MRHKLSFSAALLALALSGCVTVYQPLVSLQRPSVIDPHVVNFEGVRLLVRCVPGDALDEDEAEQLCSNLRSLFTNQGAQVEVEVAQPGFEGYAEAKKAKPDLVMELRARLLHSDSPTFLWVLSVATLTLVPAVTDSTFAQDIVIRDGQGFLLVSDSLQARFVRYTGVGLWAVNAGLDLLVRAPSEKLTGDAPKQDFTRDFHAQLSQLAFNARMRSAVLKSFEPELPSPKQAP